MHHTHDLLPGTLRFVCPLAPIGTTTRTLGLRRDDVAQVCYAIPPRGSRSNAGELARTIRRHARVTHPHILEITDVTLSSTGTVHITTPYTGNPEGLVTLADLMVIKGGRFSPFEVARGVVQLLEAAEHAHDSGLYHGPLTPEGVLVDTRGSLLVELYGVRRLIDGLECHTSAVARDEVASIAALAFTMFTGMPAAEPRVRASRLVRRLDRAWDSWFDDALDPVGGFDSASEALAALPGRGMVEVRPESAGVISRLRRAVTPSVAARED